MDIWGAILNWIFTVLDWLHGISGDWGMAIILITILFRILIFPITAKQIKSALVMQQLQPKIKEIQTKYANDKMLQQQKMMEVYKDAKFNPLSGCLPLILQMPLFFALFSVLNNLPSYIIDPAAMPVHFYGLVPNLQASAGSTFAESPLGAIPYLVLVLIFGASMLLPLLINGTKDRNTWMMTGVMGVLMLWFGWSAPAGVLLYWDTSSLIGVAQQMVTKKLMDRKMEAAGEGGAVEIKPVKVEVERMRKKNPPS
ncbi:MAG: YidC/Oxa1 family membrane protein insertase [Actinomycetia bacterium]|nr:YidC/Oxa1 family membrane protein insertase [Actinomycetes bacterium]